MRTRLTSEQRRALRDVERCRTAALGGHVERCGGCDHTRISYRSCRNRHCPKCCASQQAAWLSREAAILLPVEYHHVVFTLLAEVNPIGLQNPTAVYDALMSATAQAIYEVAADPKHLGAEVGLLLVLHTWGQTLSYHPHVHGIATGGGLTPDRQWRSFRPGFFLPVRVLRRKQERNYGDAGWDPVIGPVEPIVAGTISTCRERGDHVQVYADEIDSQLAQFAEKTSWTHLPLGTLFGGRGVLGMCLLVRSVGC